MAERRAAPLLLELPKAVRLVMGRSSGSGGNGGRTAGGNGGWDGGPDH
jgi:hypothetical protein